MCKNLFACFPLLSRAIRIMARLSLESRQKVITLPSSKSNVLSDVSLKPPLDIHHILKTTENNRTDIIWRAMVYLSCALALE